MGQVDFAKVISAAAVSTLGVLSLIVVAVGLLAFQFFKGSGDKTKLTVWLTALIAGGLFAAAFIRQADRSEPEPEPTATPGPVGPTAPVGPPAPEPSATPTPTPSASATRAAVAPAEPEADIDAEPQQASADLTGQWHDEDGNSYNISHYGNNFSVQQWRAGIALGYGQGQMVGRNLRYGFVTADGSQGQCTATVAASNRRITGMCTNGIASSAFTVER